MGRPQPLADIPANVVTGRRGAGQHEVIASLLASRPHGERWAVLRNDPDSLGPPTGAPDAQGVWFSSVADGCICCSAQVGLRVALTRLLRESRPQRVLIEPSYLARTSEVLQLLSDRWLAPVLDLRATVAVVDASAKASSVGEIVVDELDRERFRCADIIAIRGADLLTADALAVLEGALAAATPGALLLNTDRQRIDPGMLMRAAGARPRRRFWREDAQQG